MLGEFVGIGAITESTIAHQSTCSAAAKYTTFHILNDNKKMLDPFINRAYTEVAGMLKCNHQN